MNYSNITTTLAGLCLVIISGCTGNSIKGTWQYDGGTYNGKSQKASPDFQMQRTYTSDSYEAYILEGEAEPELYNSGVYSINGDTLSITSKFSSQPSQNTDITIAYKYNIEGSVMTTNGILPNGMVVEEYWKKVD